jgi:hypothetical protein
MISKALLTIHFGETFGCTRCIFERYSTNHTYPCALFPLAPIDKKAHVCKEFFIKEKGVDPKLFAECWRVESIPSIKILLGELKNE